MCFYLLIIVYVFVLVAPLLYAPSMLSDMARKDFARLTAHILERVIILIVVPLTIERVVRIFFKKQSRRWWLFWLIFVITSIRSTTNYFNEFKNDIVAIKKKQFTNVCVDTIRERVSETGILKMIDMEQRDNILLSMKSDTKLICHKASDVYFSCLQENTEETCNTQYIKTVVEEMDKYTNDMILSQSVGKK